ncbi:MAG: hypothetical protein B6U89_01420 [Desulfurococcales archaeon ex4484_58]|nr:MAG: hypothetical protein B6U89_01420 [Desulfurococcales archaeon ex4484_58]
MIMRPLVIAVYEPRWFMRVLNILRKRSVPFSIFESVDNIPYSSVFYTDYSFFVNQVRDRGDLYIVYDPMHSCRELERSILAMKFKDYYNEVVVGIDPGKKPYMVIIGDGEILEHKYIDLSRVEEEIVGYLNCYPARQKLVRVGGGYNGWRIILRIREVIDSRIEVVDEEETTPKQNRVDDLVVLDKYLSKLSKPYRNKDAYAALKIALRKGIEVE